MGVLERNLLQLSDVSLLAHVQRAVVSGWRTRYDGRTHPFPIPARVANGQELFAADDVVEWLEVTGCGNNPDAREDAVAFTLTASEVTDDEVLFAGLGALICLRGAVGPLPTDVEALLDAAEQFDGDDELLFGEVEALGPLLEPLGRYAELLVASAFDPSEPFDELVRRRQLRAGRPPVHPTLRRLVARTVVALAEEASFAEPVLVVRTVEDVDLVVAAATLSERRGTMSIGVTLSASEAESAGARLTRRWLHVHGLAQTWIDADQDGAYVLPDQSVLVLRIPTSGLDREGELDEVNNLCLNLSKDNRAVVVGPAASLTDALLAHRGPGRPSDDGPRLSVAGEIRRDALRTDVVRAIVRLPQGLFPEHSRSRAALWCLGSSRSMPASTLCADVNRPLSDEAEADLLTDLTAGMQGPRTEVARQLSTARFRPTSALSVSTQDLVAPVVREVHLGSTPILQTLRDLLGCASIPVPGIAPVSLAPVARPAVLPRVSLERAVRERRIVLVPGARVALSGTSPRGTVPVVQHPSDLDRRDELPALTELELAAAYPHVDRTRPGDVVVTSAGGPAAAVDHLGGLVVAFPARVLRCHRPRPSTPEERAEFARQGRQPPELAAQTFTPEAVAADINAQPSSARSWKAWPLTVLPMDQVEVTESLLSELAERRARLEQALAEIDTTVRTVTQAVGAQICTVGSPGPSSTLERTVV